MDKVFNIKRFWSVLKHDFFTNWKMSAVLLALPMLFWVILEVLCNKAAEISHQIEDGWYYSQSMRTITGWMVFFIIVDVLAIFFASMRTYNNFLDKKNRFDTLSLPATLFEKMLSRNIFYFLIPVLISILYCYLYWQLPVMEYNTHNMKYGDVVLMFTVGYFFAMLLLAIFGFWSSCLKTFIVPFPPVAIIVLLIWLVVKIEGCVNMMMFDGLVKYIIEDKGWGHLIIAESVFFVIFCIINFAASYWVLSKRQIR